ncbi:flagellar hook-associated protein FlgK [Cellulosilyticum sp. WCF-2]|uniref:flagellar hook-associated protein FlgK n=1 Tax=Cellulosilyticum sp. WCF-2 TaxID=2497860 RepID=UPI0016808A14|nr:flagellar hook-associated protein FlgK [Cellulosilyticum sp. WCF-2]
MAFFEFNVALSGLFAAQRGLHVTSNNITNASTDGYSRQILGQRADTPLSGFGVGMTGTGVMTTNVTRVRDSYLDLKLWTQNPKLGEYNIKVTQNSLIEGAFGEPSDAGFTKVFNDLFNSFDEVSKDPTSGAAKVSVRENLISFGKYYSNISTALTGYQQNLNYEIKATVDEINILGTRIQNLNNQIFQAEIYGDDANSFRDERDVCIDRLSELINVEAKEEEKVVEGKVLKTFSVKIAGQTFVDHLNLNTLGVEVRGEKEQKIDDIVNTLSGLYEKLKNGGLTVNEITNINEQIKLEQKKLTDLTPECTIDVNGNITYNSPLEGKIEVLKVNPDFSTEIKTAGDGKFNVEDVDGLYNVIWQNGLSFDMGNANLSGELKGLIDLRDGCGTAESSEVTYNGIPYYISRLNGYVRQFAQTMNDEYSKDKDGTIMIAGGLTYGGKEVAYIERDESGKIVKCYDEDKNEIAGLSAGELEEIGNKYTTKYKLFSYSTGSSTGIPATGEDLVGNDYSKMTATNITISKEIYENASNMRSTYDTDKESGGDLFRNLSNQKDNSKMFKEGDPKDYMASIFSELGINAQEAIMYQSTQESVTGIIKNQRLSVSQVDLTEEFTNLIKYQQAYQASAKIMNTIDGIYETTIFKLGNF